MSDILIGSFNNYIWGCTGYPANLKAVYQISGNARYRTGTGYKINLQTSFDNY
jgi:hypothetical protein